MQSPALDDQKNYMHVQPRTIAFQALVHHTASSASVVIVCIFMSTCTSMNLFSLRAARNSLLLTMFGRRRAIVLAWREYIYSDRLCVTTRTKHNSLSLLHMPHT